MLESLYEELIALCEIRGQLDEKMNVLIEKKIASIQTEIKELEKETA